MLYEYRRYEATPGKLGLLNKRFATVTIHIWERLGIKPIGFWTADVGTSNELHYILQWQSMADREQRWGAFMADKEWHEKRAASEVDGPLVARMTNSFWSPTNYSPLQ
jgi:hypothetical protein